jgi:hypothetical protein
MNNTKTWILATILTLCGCSIGLSSCKSGKNISETNYPLLAGTLEEAVKPDSAPARILEAMERAERFHSYEIMSDTLHYVCVEAIGEVDATPTEGYGIVVEKGASSPHSTISAMLANPRLCMMRRRAPSGLPTVPCGAQEYKWSASTRYSSIKATRLI